MADQAISVHCRTITGKHYVKRHYFGSDHRYRFGLLFLIHTMKLIKLTPHTDDRNSCTVNALSTATDMPWHEAQAIMAKYGRRRNRGVATSIVNRVYKDVLGIECTVPDSRPTLAQFVRANPKGKFIVRVAGHVFVVKNGKQYDTFLNGARKRVRGYWPVK